MEEIEIVNEFVDFYEILKKDVHTLLATKSENPIDYTGKVHLYKNIAFLKYMSLGTNLDFAKMNKKRWQQLIERMIKSDINLWGKPQDATDITFGCDPTREEAVFTISYYN